MSFKRLLLRLPRISSGSALSVLLIIAFFCFLLALPAPARATTTSVRIVKYAADGKTVVAEKNVDYQWMEDNLPVYGDGLTHYYHQGPTFDENNLWDPSETVNLKDQGAVKGTSIKDLCELVGGMVPGETVRIKASDGFSKDFPYANVYNPPPEQGPIVLTWYCNGKYIPEYGDGMKLVFLAQTQNKDGQYVFGNTDMKECLPEQYWHYYEMYPTSNGYTVKYVNEIIIFSNEAPPEQEPAWELELSGAVSKRMSQAEFEEGVRCHGVEYKDDSGTWKGIPLWYLVGMVDDGKEHGSGAFNDQLAQGGYSVTLIAGDGYTVTLDSKTVARNNNYIVACFLNGAPLPASDAQGKALAPLKLVGSEVSGGKRIGNIVKITLGVEPAPVQKSLTLIGQKTQTFTLDQIKALPSYTARGAFKKSSGAIVGPYEYTGVKITDLADLVGGIASSGIKVTSLDGYSMSYTYDQINGKLTTYNPKTGDEEPATGPIVMIVAYEENGSPIPLEEGGPLRIAFVGQEAPVTDGHFWVKQINQIEILGGVEEWQLELVGAITETMDRSTFESGAGCHRTVYLDENGNEWSGIPLWMLVGRVDDGDSHDFNDDVASAGYDVTVVAADGYCKTFSSQVVTRNNDIIVANEVNGRPLTAAEGWPLRLTGSALQKAENVKNVVKITVSVAMAPPTPAAPTKTFADIQGHWAQKDIELMAGLGIAGGVAADRFDPDGLVTRAQFAAFLVRSLGIAETKPAAASFTDVGPEAWYYGAVEAARQAGLIGGYPDGSFKPNQGITREEMTAMAVRAMAKADKLVTVADAEGVLARFADKDTIGSWVRQPVAQAVEAGLVGGREGSRLAPKENATRAEAVGMLKRLLVSIGRIGR
ncbi:S-layer homology domain-containing protein [Moorellaceae bacterium AZ2]